MQHAPDLSCLKLNQLKEKERPIYEGEKLRCSTTNHQVKMGNVGEVILMASIAY